MAGLDNPFAQLLNPDEQGAGTILGMIGRAAGVPSQAGTARGEAIAAITDMIQNQGKNPQQAVIEFFKTPAGQQAFVRDPGIMKTIQATIQSITPPQPQVISTPPGYRTDVRNQFTGKSDTLTQPTAESQTIRDTGRMVQTPPGYKTSVMGGPGGDQTITNPPTDVQSFSDFAEIAKLPPEELQRLAADRTLIGNRYTIHSITNSTGDNIGLAIVDQRHGQVRYLNDVPGTNPNPNPSVGDKPGQNTVPNSMRTPDGNVDVPKLIQGKAGMFIGSGLWPNILATANTMLSSGIHPSLGIDEGRAATQRQNDLQDLRTAVTLFPQTVGRSNKIIDTVTKNLSFGTFGSDPLDAVTTGLQIHDDAQRAISVAENTTKDLRLPKEVRVDAQKEIIGWNRIINALPSRGEMVEMQKAIRANQIPGLGVTGAGKALIGGANKALTAGQKVMQGNEPVEPGVNPNEPTQPTQPVTSAPQPSMDIANMPADQLAKLNPRTLTLEQRKQLQVRLKALLGTTQKK